MTQRTGLLFNIFAEGDVNWAKRIFLQVVTLKFSNRREHPVSPPVAFSQYLLYIMLVTLGQGIILFVHLAVAQCVANVP